jgi:hypothetical protein
VAVEDTLSFVTEDVDTAVDGAFERGKQRVPPCVGEILSVVDDDGIESMTGFELGCEISHLEREFMFPETGRSLRCGAIRPGLRVRPIGRRVRGTHRRTPAATTCEVDIGHHRQHNKNTDYWLARGPRFDHPRRRYELRRQRQIWRVGSARPN